MLCNWAKKEKETSEEGMQVLLQDRWLNVHASTKSGKLIRQTE